MRALVTGANGFVGKHLVPFLLQKGYEVCGTYHGHADEGSRERYRMVPLDVADKETMLKLVGEFNPSEIYHLAGVAVSTGQPRRDYYRVNFGGSLNLFDVVMQTDPNTRVLFIGSSNEYGPVPAECQPIRESESLCPTSHYAASKAAADLAACSYAAEGLQVIRVRAFNHNGPGQTTDYVCSRLAKLVAEVSLGLREPVIEAGNLDAVRDFTDVRDVVRAYWLLLQKARSGDVYNVCSQRAFGVRDTIVKLASAAAVEIEVRTRADLLRKTDIPVLVGNREKIFQDTGWEPQIDFGQTLNDLLLWWRQSLTERI
jgi:GDP-4-dehydro-6-deoxy-D-mannose reductase